MSQITDQASPNPGLALTYTYSAVATRLEKVSFHSSPKERQCQKMFKLLHNCIHLTHIHLKILKASTVHELKTPDVQADLEKAEDPGINLPTFVG